MFNFKNKLGFNFIQRAGMERNNQWSFICFGAFVLFIPQMAIIDSVVPFRDIHVSRNRSCSKVCQQSQFINNYRSPYKLNLANLSVEWILLKVSPIKQKHLCALMFSNGFGSSGLLFKLCLTITCLIYS